MTFLYSAWLTKNGELTIQKIDRETGIVTKTKHTGIHLTKKQWNKMR